MTCTVFGGTLNLAQSINKEYRLSILPLVLTFTRGLKLLHSPMFAVMAWSNCGVPFTNNVKRLLEKVTHTLLNTAHTVWALTGATILADAAVTPPSSK